MRQQLRDLYRATSGTPQLQTHTLMKVAVLNDHVVQFPTDDDAAYAVAAWRAVPALLDELDEHDRRAETGALEKALEQVRDLEERLAAKNDAYDVLERALAFEVAERTKAQNRARFLAVTIRNARERNIVP